MLHSRKETCSSRDEESSSEAGWKHAALAILRHPLPVLQTKHLAADATEHIEAIEKFAQDLRTWLKCFASNLCEYKRNKRYRNDVASSMKALEKRRRTKEDLGIYNH